jgi:hypothetical protein
MNTGGMSLARALPIDAALMSDVLIKLRRDISGSVARWTLGEHGAAEVDIEFFPISVAEDAFRPAWSTTARIWDTEGVALAHLVIELNVVAVDECTLSVRPELPLAPWWSTRVHELLDLEQATLDELSEELLWHASRGTVATRRDF